MEFSSLASWTRLRDRIAAREPAGREISAFARESGLSGHQAIKEAERLMGIYAVPRGLAELLESLRRQAAVYEIGGDL